MTAMPEKQAPSDYGSEFVRRVPSYAEGSIYPGHMLAVESESEADDRLPGD